MPIMDELFPPEEPTKDERELEWLLEHRADPPRKAVKIPFTFGPRPKKARKVRQ